MKVIFLDFDGVLNSEKYIRTYDSYGLMLIPQNMLLLQKIVKATNAKIVLSTSWRRHWKKIEADCDEVGQQMNRIFGEYQMQIWDKTPRIKNTRRREDEIKAWLDAFPNVENYVVLDDMFLYADFLENHFVRTSNFRDGLDADDVKKAIEILNGF